MEAEQEALHARIASPDFYKEPADAIARSARAHRRVEGLPARRLRALGRARFAIESLTLRRHRRLAATRRRVRAPVDLRAGGFPAVGAFRVRRALDGARLLVDLDHIAVGLGQRRFLDREFCLPAVAEAACPASSALAASLVLVVRRGDRLGFVASLPAAAPR